MYETYLNQALALAQIRQGFCAPNPAVGAILVKDNAVIAMGYHQGAGYPHAEAIAIEKAGTKARGATLYVSLEPCCHWGKTPPCTDTIITAGIEKVVYGYKDPNPKVNGQGELALNKAGVNTEFIPLDPIKNFYRPYTHWVNTGLPYLTAKIALSLDGKIALQDGQPTNITGETAAAFTHQQRKQADAILTTVKTIIKDDPKLNARFHEESYAKPLYILDRTLALPLTAKIFQTAKSITVFHQTGIDPKQQNPLLSQGVRCIAIPGDTEGLDLSQILTHIGQDGVQSLYVEAGGTLFKSLITEGLCQKAYIYVAPKWIDKLAQAAFPGNISYDFSQLASSITWFSLGNDACCELLFE